MRGAICSGMWPQGLGGVLCLHLMADAVESGSIGIYVGGWFRSVDIVLAMWLHDVARLVGVDCDCADAAAAHVSVGRASWLAGRRLAQPCRRRAC